jgi:hypothetical protein
MADGPTNRPRAGFGWRGTSARRFLPVLRRRAVGMVPIPHARLNRARRATPPGAHTNIRRHEQVAPPSVRSAGHMNPLARHRIIDVHGRTRRVVVVADRLRNDAGSRHSRLLCGVTLSGNVKQLSPKRSRNRVTPLISNRSKRSDDGVQHRRDAAFASQMALTRVSIKLRW